MYRRHRRAIGISTEEDECIPVTLPEGSFNESGNQLMNTDDSELSGDVNAGLLQPPVSSTGTATPVGDVTKQTSVSQCETAAKFLLALKEGCQIS